MQNGEDYFRLSALVDYVYEMVEIEDSGCLFRLEPNRTRLTLCLSASYKSNYNCFSSHVIIDLIITPTHLSVVL